MTRSKCCFLSACLLCTNTCRDALQALKLPAAAFPGGQGYIVAELPLDLEPRSPSTLPLPQGCCVDICLHTSIFSEEKSMEKCY